MRNVYGFVVLLVMIVFSSGVWAKEKQHTAYELKGLTVTAQKTGQNIQDVPVSVTAFSDVDIEDKGIKGFHDLIDHVPNLFIRKNSTDNAVVIRGISSFASSLYSTAGFYVDGINYPIHQMQDMSFLDIERIEVLKGPQGTLYGRNSQAGVINIITKTPSNKYSGKVFADIGMWDANGGKLLCKEGFTANLPLLQDTFSLRLTGEKEDSRGWMKNTYNGENALDADRLSGRLSALWTPKDDLQVTLLVEGRKKQDGLGYYRYTSGPHATGHNTLAWNGKNKNSMNANAQMLKIEYKGEFFDLTSVTGRHSYEQDFINDMDMSTQNFGAGFENSYGEYEVTVLSEELRLSSNREQNHSFDWLTGVYAYMEEADTIYYGYGLHDTQQDNWGAAFFGQGTWNITPSWHLTLGGRLDYTHLQGEKTLNLASQGGGLSILKGDIHSTEILPSISLAYDFTDAIMSYARISRGYLAGGFDYATSINNEQFQFDPEYSWNYELGVKSMLLNNRLTANATVFYIDIADKQVAQLEPTVVNPENRRIINAAKAESYGAELELEYKPLPGLLFYASLGYMDSRLRDWVTVADSFDYDGKKTPGSPNWTYSIGGTYRWDNGFFLGTDITGVSSYYTDPKNSSKVDGRILVNPRIGYEGESFSLMLWAKNVFNQQYDENKWDWGGSTLVQQGAPRSVGIKAAYSF